jgi:nicotinamide phosphoribosyltransferase
MVIDGVHTDVFKRPIDVSKSSKTGRLALIPFEGKLVTVSDVYHRDNILQLVFENGVLHNEISFEQVRANAALPVEVKV